MLNVYELDVLRCFHSRFRSIHLQNLVSLSKGINTKLENRLLEEFQCHSMRFFTHDTLQEVSPMRNTKHQLRFYYIFIKSPLSYELVSLTDPGRFLSDNF